MQRRGSGGRSRQGPASSPWTFRHALRYRRSMPEPVHKSAPHTDQTLTFAVVSGSPSAEADLAAICHDIEQALSRPVLPRVLPSYAALEQEVTTGRAQILWAPPLVALE